MPRGAFQVLQERMLIKPVRDLVDQFLEPVRDLVDQSLESWLN